MTEKGSTVSLVAYEAMSELMARRIRGLLVGWIGCVVILASVIFSMAVG